jgi:hypothetical protein
LVSAFLGAFVLWLIYAATGVITPGVIGQLESIPPMHSLLDVDFFGIGSRLLPGGLILLLILLIVLIRAGLLTLWLTVLIDRFERGTQRGDEPPPSLFGRHSFRIYQSLLAIEAGFLIGLFLLANVVALMFGQLGIVFGPILLMYFLVYVPVVSAAEGLGPVASVRPAIRAARLRGWQHAVLVFGYVIGTLSLLLRRYSPDLPATPTVLTWAFALFTTFVHLSVQGTVVHRWLSVREPVLAAEESAEAETAPRGLR